MPFIALLLSVKIAVTGLCVAAPFLFLPTARLAQMTGVEGGGNLFRLYGVAVLALLFGYASGFPQIAMGYFPWGIVLMGLVSNGGAALILFATGAWRKQRAISVFIAAITICLGLSCLNAKAAMAPLW